jgi:chemotaxis response regulator CheB
MVEAGGSSGNAFDSLLHGACESFGDNTAVFLLSGDGSDGSDGMREIRKIGGKTYALSPHSCLKPDLPRMVLDAGHADEIGTIADIAFLLESSPSVLFGNTITSGVKEPGNLLRDHSPDVDP